MSLTELEAEFGSQVRAARVHADLDQKGLAELADVSVSTISNLENGRGSSLTTLIRVVRALGRMDWLEMLAPTVTVSPLAMLDAHGRKTSRRQRVRRPAG